MMRDKGWVFALALALPAGCATPPPADVDRAVEAPRPQRKGPERVAQLLDMPADSLVAALGNPVLRKSENGGEVWLYAHANGCSLDVVLFPARKVLTVAHATTETPASLSESECLSAIGNLVP